MKRSGKSQKKQRRHPKRCTPTPTPIPHKRPYQQRALCVCALRCALMSLCCYYQRGSATVRSHVRSRTASLPLQRTLQRSTVQRSPLSVLFARGSCGMWYLVPVSAAVSVSPCCCCLWPVPSAWSLSLSFSLSRELGHFRKKTGKVSSAPASSSSLAHPVM